MHSAQILQALAVALSAFSLAQAAAPDANVHARGVNEVIKRQQSGSTTGTTTPAASTTTTPTTSKTTQQTTTSTTPTTTARTTSSSQPPATTPTGNSPTTTPTATPSTPQSTSTSDDTKTETTETPTLTTSAYTTTIVTTRPDGQVTSITSEGITTATAPGSLTNNGSGNTSGMDDKTRNTIIGVVVGIGGAIVLAVVGVVAWRIWGRKRNQEEAEGTFGTGYTAAEKPEPTGSTSSRTPFQSTLESYHAPTQVNTASNF